MLEIKRPVRESARFSMVGVGALSLLALIHWLRDSGFRPEAAGDYLLGVGPNFVAAIAIAFVLMGIWADQKRDAAFAASKRAFFVCASISGVGLILWEFVQKTGTRLVFDPHDLGATVLGVSVGYPLFYFLSKRAGERG